MAKKKDVRIVGSASVSMGDRSISLNEDGSLVLINEYGNSARYDIEGAHSFDALWSNLWQFAKDSQH